MEMINASHGHKNRTFNIQSISYIFRIVAEGPYYHILAKVCLLYTYAWKTKVMTA